MLLCVFFFKQKTAYEILRSDWSSDVCSSDLRSIARRISGRASCGFFLPGRGGAEIGRASCRERVCQYVEISVVAVSLKKKEDNTLGLGAQDARVVAIEPAADILGVDIEPAEADRRSGGVGIFFFKQKTAYEILRSDWSSDVCSSDLCSRWSASSVGRANPGVPSSAT